MTALVVAASVQAGECISYDDYLHEIGSVGGFLEDMALGTDIAVGVRGGNLDVFDITNPYSPSVLGSVVLPDVGRAVAVAGQWAFVACQWEGLQIVDLTAPESPHIVSSVPMVGVALSLFVAEGYAYVGHAHVGLEIIDVRDPVNPALVGRFLDSNTIDHMFVQGDHVYTAQHASLKILNVSDKTAPRLLRTVTGYYPEAVAAEGDLLYVDLGFRLGVFDISDAAAPVQIGMLSLDGAGSGSSICIRGDKLFLARGNLGLSIVDISVPSSPVHLGTIDPGFVLALDVRNELVYSAGYGLQILDATNFAAAPRLGVMEPRSLTESLDVDSGFVYLASQYGGVRIFDASNPSEITLVRTISDIYYPRQIAVSDAFGYVATGSSGLSVIDVHDPVTADVVSTPDTGAAYGVVVAGKFAYLRDTHSVEIVDVSDPLAARALGQYWASTWTRAIAVQDGYGFLGTMDGLEIFDASDPMNPSRVSVIDSGEVSGIAIEGSLAFVAIKRGRMETLDISDPAHAQLVSSYDLTPGELVGIEADGSVVYLGFKNRGVLVIDVSNPSAPLLIGETPGERPMEIVAEEYLFFADSLGGSRAAYLQCGAVAPVPVGLTIAPSTLNVSSSGRWIQATFQFPSSVAVDAEILHSLTLNGRAISDFRIVPAEEGDVEQPGMLRLKLSRKEILARLPLGMQVAVAILGEFESGTVFEAATFVRVMDPGRMSVARVEPARVVSGETVRISWEDISQGDSPRSVAAYLSTDGGETWVEILAARLSTNAFDWRVPALEPPTTTAQLVVESKRGSTVNLAQMKPFAIHSQPELKPRESSDKRSQLSAFPNPANPSTALEFYLPNVASIELSIYDTAGRLVCVLADGRYTAGNHFVVWSGLDRSGSEVASGIYYSHLRIGSDAWTKRLVLVK